MDEEFADQLKCPICFEIPENEVFQCRNGHTICTKCSNCLEACPQCRVPFGNGNKIRVRALESLLDSMRFECSNKDFGCKEKLKRKEMASHTEVCFFNQKPFHFCKLIGNGLCNYSLSTLSIPIALRHLQNEHGVIGRTGDRLEILQENFTKVIANHSDKGFSVWTPILLNLEKDCEPSFIILSMTNGEDKTASWICLFLGDSLQEANEFIVDFSIQNNLSEDEIPQLNWKVSPIPLTQAETALKIRPYRIPVSSLAQHYAVKGTLKVKVTLTRKFTEVDLSETDTRTKSTTTSNLEPVSIFTTCFKPIAGVDRRFVSSRLESHCPTSGEVAVVFQNVSCDLCRQKPLNNVRYKCLQCPNYDLCKTCKEYGSHSHHVFAALTNPNQLGFIADLLRTRVEMNFHSTNQSGSHTQTITPDCSPLPDGVTCNGCCVVPISGTRYKCLQCSDFNLCLPCMVHKIHCRHVLVMIQNMGQQDFVQRLTRIRSPIINGQHEADDLRNIGMNALTQPVGEPNHVSFLGVICDGCRIVRIVDTLYKCLQCNDYNLCTTCGLRGTHSHHLFVVINSRVQLDFIKRSWSLTEF